MQLRVETTVFREYPCPISSGDHAGGSSRRSGLAYDGAHLERWSSSSRIHVFFATCTCTIDVDIEATCKLSAWTSRRSNCRLLRIY